MAAGLSGRCPPLRLLSHQPPGFGQASGRGIVMVWLALLLLLNTVLHGLIVFRFGVAQNTPPAVFAVIYLILAVIVWLAVPYALWITVVVTALGTAALAVAYRSIARDRTIETIILVVNAVIVLFALYLLFAAPVA
jgi:hypothetical protein